MYTLYTTDDKGKKDYKFLDKHFRLFDTYQTLQPVLQEWLNSKMSHGEIKDGVCGIIVIESDRRFIPLYLKYDYYILNPDGSTLEKLRLIRND